MEYGIAMPYSEMAEIAVVGALIVEPSSLKLFLERDIKVDMFFLPRNKKLVEIVLKAYELHGIAETQVVMEEIASNKQVEIVVGGVDYLMKVVENSSAKSSVDHYLTIIEEKHRLRQLIRTSQEIIKDATIMDSNVDDFLFQAEEKIVGVTRTNNQDTMLSSKVVVKESMDNFHKAMENDGKITGLETGFGDLDYITNGFQQGDLIILGARPSVGKGHPNWLELPTPNGSKRMDQLHVGDYVFDRYGNPTKITGVYPRGELETYRVTLNDGRSTIVDGDHIWSHFMLSGCGNESLIDKTTEYMYKQGVRNKGNRAKYNIPTNKPVNFDEKVHEIDPYVIGALIGDGCLLESRLTISSNDPFVIEKVGNYLEVDPLFTKYNNFSWVFPKGNGKHLMTKNVLTTHKEMINYSHEKEIPKEYLYDSYLNRMKLLNGLFDTDGSAFSKGKNLSVSYSTTSEKLKDQVVWLLQSCGYLTSVVVDSREGRRDCYDIRVLADPKESKKLFSLNRKREIVEESERVVHRKYDRIGIKSIEKTGIKEDIICISVDNKEQLYLANDFIVTHNTAFALNLALNVAQRNKEGLANIALFSLEMPATHLMNRLISTVSTVPNQKIRSGKVNQDEYNQISLGANTIQKTNMFVDDSSGTTVANIFKQCRSLNRDDELDLIIIDYIQLIESSQGSQNRQQEVSKISRQLKNLAREMNVPVIALSQLSRKLEDREDKRPRLSDLRESGAIEQDADIVMFLHRDDYGADDEEEGAISTSNTSETLVRISKHRNGSLGDLYMMFEKDTGKFYQKAKGY